MRPGHRELKDELVGDVDDGARRADARRTYGGHLELDRVQVGRRAWLHLTGAADAVAARHAFVTHLLPERLVVHSKVFALHAYYLNQFERDVAYSPSRGIADACDEHNRLAWHETGLEFDLENV